MTKTNPDHRPKYYKWRVGAFLFVHGFIFLHLILWYQFGWTVFGSIGMQELFRTFVQKGILNAGAFFFLILILMSFLWGRAFCGWGCHVGLLYDLLEPLYKRWLPKYTIRLRFGPWMAAFILLFIFLRPAVLTRMQQPPDQTIVMELAQTEPWALLPGWIFGLIIMFSVIVLLPLFFGRRAFCKTLCPWGITLGLTNPISRLKIRKVSPCSFCGQCSLACPMDLDVSRLINTKLRVSNVACTGCLYCLEACSSGTISFTTKNKEFAHHQQLPKNINHLEHKNDQPLGVEIGFWAITLIIGMIYGEIYGIGYFLAFSMGLMVALLSIICLRHFFKSSHLYKVGTFLCLCCLWVVILKDGTAHYHYRQGLQLFNNRKWAQSQEHLEKSDALFWSPPTELFLKLYTIYKETGQREKQESVRKRYDARREAKRARSSS